MKALKITEKGCIKTIEMDAPEAVKADEVLLKLNYVGFCGSDLNTFRGGNVLAKDGGVIPGHEIGATIVECGAGVPANLKKDMVVTVNPYTNCNNCSSCRNGRVNACEHNETMGVQRDGAMMEYIKVPWQKVIPADGISPRDCALIEPMSVGFHAVDRAQVTDNDVVVVFGCGMIGCGAIVRAALRGATVIAVDLDDEKLELAKRIGARYAVNSGRENVAEAVKRLNNGCGADVVVEAVGAPATYVAAIDTVCFTGRVVCIGYAKSDVSFTTRFFVQKELDIRGSRNATPNDFRAVIRYMQGGNCPADELITKVVAPEETQETMEYWDKNPGKVFRILVKF